VRQLIQNHLAFFQFLAAFFVVEFGALFVVPEINENHSNFITCGAFFVVPFKSWCRSLSKVSCGASQIHVMSHDMSCGVVLQFKLASP